MTAGWDSDSSATPLALRLQLNNGRDLPERFRDPATWKDLRRGQHPCYTTTNNTYGVKLPSQQELPNSFNGINGKFTPQFPGMPRNTGFVTSKIRSTVHRTLDEF